MNILNTGTLADSVISVNGDIVNFFLIKSDDGFIAIDGGNESQRVLEELSILGIGADEIKAVLLTHSDRDHIAGTGVFKDATVYLAQNEEQIISGNKKRFLLFSNKLETDYRVLYDNQELEINGINIRCILTPGHTPGSMCFLINGKYLFVGDTMSLKDGRVLLFNDTFNMDSELQKTSLEKLSKLENAKYIFTAHYGFTDNFSKAFENW